MRMSNSMIKMQEDAIKQIKERWKREDVAKKTVHPNLKKTEPTTEETVSEENYDDWKNLYITARSI